MNFRFIRSADEWAHAALSGLSFTLATLLFMAMHSWGKEPPPLWESYLLVVVVFASWTVVVRSLIWLRLWR